MNSKLRGNTCTRVKDGCLRQEEFDGANILKPARLALSPLEKIAHEMDSSLELDAYWNTYRGSVLSGEEA